MSERHAAASSCTELPDLLTINDLISALKLLNWSDANVSENVRQLLMSYNGNDWECHCCPGSDCYRKKIVLHNDDNFTLILLCFQPEKGNAIHNHGEACCLFKVLKGEILEKQYRKPCPGEEMKWRAKIVYGRNTVNSIAKMSNPHSCKNISFDQSAASLVIYFPSISECHVFDEKTGEATPADVTFDSPDNDINSADENHGISGYVRHSDDVVPNRCHHCC